MTWPGITDYSEAIQNPRLCFEGADLEAGTVAVNQRGMPLVFSGNFACVYSVEAGGRKFAVRCFTREVKDQQDRYNKLSEYLIDVLPPSFVHFEYVEQGINLKGTWYPIVKMEWVEGERLNNFVESNLYDPDTLRRLAAQWRGGPAVNLRGLGIAHNDLQHGNVMVQADGRIRLVDYDGMFLPGFLGERSPELGHRNFHHPRRTADDYDAYVDNFPSLVVYLSLLAIASDPGLWDEYHNLDNLVFTRDDYAAPGRSPVFDRLKQSRDRTVSRLAERLEECCALAVEAVPDLEAILQGSKVQRGKSQPEPAQPTGEPSYREELTGQTSPSAAQRGTSQGRPAPRPAGAVDRDVLAALYNATGGPSWKDDENWLSDLPLETWYGVTTDRAGRVTGLSLSYNQLRGQIPPEIGKLPNLIELTLYHNKLRGQIPPELGNLSALERLDLDGNQLRGQIPVEIGNLSALERLNLDDNQLSGQIPPELGNLSNLEYLSLHGNQLSGQIPPELGNLSNLEQLELYDNQLSGRIPPELGNLSELKWLDLEDNLLSGQIPPELGNLSNLEQLWLSDNQLRGEIPPELGNLSNLERLYLSGNQLSGCVPPALRNVEDNDFDRLGLPFCDGFFHRLFSAITEDPPVR